jgi:nicotinate-nucleotide adenylyltransferase
MTSLSPQATPKQRIGLYGGAFDPVHVAHVDVARAALTQGCLDRVIFIPAARSPLKAHGPVASDADRLEMLRLALLDEPRFVVDEAELVRGGVSYSLDTVRIFNDRYPDAELFWIIGADQLERLGHWHRIEQLTKLVGFLVLARPGHGLQAPEIAGLRWSKIDAPLMPGSSTAIRDRLAEGTLLDRLLDKRVEAFISARGLYTSDQ